VSKKLSSGFGARLRQVRGEMSQAEFAELVGANRQQVTNWENERSEPSIEKLAAIGLKTGYADKWLLTGEGPPTVKEAMEVLGRSLLRVTEEQMEMLERLKRLGIDSAEKLDLLLSQHLAEEIVAAMERRLKGRQPKPPQGG
jgi:transcriptional regulator with XRE-family HTH domain